MSLIGGQVGYPLEFNSNAPRYLSYQHEVDTMVIITTSGYFNGISTNLRIKDCFYIKAQDQTAFYEITAVSPNVTVSPVVDAPDLTLTDGQFYIGNGSNVAVGNTISGDFTISNTGVGAISAGVIVDSDISASAGISYSKLATLTAANIVVGNSSNIPTSVTMSGDVSLNSSGVATIQIEHKKSFWCRAKVSADLLASDATARFSIGSTQDKPITISSIIICPDGNLTGDNTNYATLLFQKQEWFSPYTVTTLLSIDTKASSGTGNWTAFSHVGDGGLAPSVATVEAQAMVTLTITKSGTGVVVPAFNVLIEFTFD